MAATVGIGLLGLGTVGTAVARRLIDEWELLGERAGATPVLRRVAVRDAERPRTVNLKNVPLVSDPTTVVDDPDVRIVIEVIGGREPAATLIEHALAAGKTVVTANKLLVAHQGPELSRLAEQHGAGLWFEATVGAGLPVIALLRGSLGADRISRIDAIINGTTNVILTHMRRDGITLRAALADATERGYAEADPSADLDGWDAAHKLVIMSWLAFGVHVQPESVDRVGIRDIDLADLAYTGQLGYTVKLVAHAHTGDAGAVHLRVRPTAVPADHVLFGVDDSDNAVLISGDLAGEVMLRGLGAGGESTASAVVSDVVEAIRRLDAQPQPPATRPAALLDGEAVEVAQYVRLRVADMPDARQLALQALEDRGVPVVEAIDKPPIDGPDPQLLILTGSAPRAVHDRALETVDSLPFVREIVSTLDLIEPSS